MKISAKNSNRNLSGSNRKTYNLSFIIYNSRIQNYFSKKNNSGFVLLFAIIAVSIILTMTMGILTISFKEVALSTSARDSHYAFFAADTGVECGLYYDLTDSPDTQNSKSELGNGVKPVDISCDGTNIASAGPTQEADGTVIYSFTDQNLSNNGTFEIEGDNNVGHCAKVIIKKHVPNADGKVNSTTGAPIVETHIDSYGYNVACDKIGNRNAIERHLSAYYEE